MRQFLGENAPKLSDEILSALMNHPWPGNIRELQNAVQRAAILSAGATPRQSDFLLSMNPSEQLEAMREERVAPPQLGAERPQRLHEAVETIRDTHTQGILTEDGGLVIRSGTTVEDMERALILETLRAKNNNRTEAAKLLGISIRTLRNKLNDYRQGGLVIEE
jgi:two-component system response regulator FlrC